MFKVSLLILCWLVYVHFARSHSSFTNGKITLRASASSTDKIENDLQTSLKFTREKGLTSSSRHHPVVLVPGLGGSQLWAKLNKPKRQPHFFCSKHTSDYYNIWLRLTQLLPKVIDCCVDNLRLHYDRSTRTTHNTKGVDIQALHFGDPKSVEWLDPFFDKVLQALENSKKADGSFSFSRLLQSARDAVFKNLRNHTVSSLLGDLSQAVHWLPPDVPKRSKRRASFLDWIEPALRFGILSDLTYYSDMVERLVANGYTRGKDLRAAPYDFRKAPNEMSEFFSKTKSLIEDSYTQNGNSRVVVVAHSMGNPVMLYFYNHVVSQGWKDKYIRSHVALAAPWGGAMKSLKLMCSGDSLGLFVKATKLRTVERSMPSTAWLMPSPALWGPDEVLVSTPRRNYTTKDYPQLFTDLGYMDGYYMWQDTHKLNSDLKFPEVEMHCLYGVSVKTLGRLVYKDKAFPDKAPEAVMDDGDGTVNRRSLEAFLPWLQQGSSKLVKHVSLNKVEHNAILKDRQAIQYVLDLVKIR